MIKQVLVRRYGQGLINVLRDEADFRKVREELRELTGLFFEHKKFRRALASPFMSKTKKTGLVREVLERAAVDHRARNFILLLLDKGRFELLPDILDLLPLLWNDKIGTVTVEAFSAVPLSQAQQTRLRRALEAREGRPVFLNFSLDQELMGGLALRKGHVIYDLTIRGELSRLRDILAEK